MDEVVPVDESEGILAVNYGYGEEILVRGEKVLDRRAGFVRRNGLKRQCETFERTGHGANRY